MGKTFVFFCVLDVLHGVYFGVVGMKSGKLVLQDLPEKKHLTLLRAGFDILYSYIYIERERLREGEWIFSSHHMQPENQVPGLLISCQRDFL